MSGSKKQIRTDVDRRQTERMVQFLANSAHELGCHVRDIEVGAGLKPGICTQWKARLRANHITKIRDTTMKAIYTEVAKRKKARNLAVEEGFEDLKQAQRLEDAKKPSEVRVLKPIDPAHFEFNPFIQPAPTTRTSSACEALSSIVRNKLAGMSLVQLAHLLEFMETGNGNGQ